MSILKAFVVVAVVACLAVLMILPIAAAVIYALPLLVFASIVAFFAPRGDGDEDDEVESREEPPWSELDPGIRRTVRALWDAGFEPLDSGDGMKGPADMPCALAISNVVIACEPEAMLEEADRLHALICSWGVVPFAGEPVDVEPDCCSMATVEASYAPADGRCVITLLGVDDSMLPPGAGLLPSATSN